MGKFGEREKIGRCSLEIECNPLEWNLVTNGSKRQWMPSCTQIFANFIFQTDELHDTNTM